MAKMLLVVNIYVVPTNLFKAPFLNTLCSFNTSLTVILYTCRFYVLRLYGYTIYYKN